MEIIAFHHRKLKIHLVCILEMELSDFTNRDEMFRCINLKKEEKKWFHLTQAKKNIEIDSEVDDSSALMR